MAARKNIRRWLTGNLDAVTTTIFGRCRRHSAAFNLCHTVSSRPCHHCARTRVNPPIKHAPSNMPSPVSATAPRWHAFASCVHSQRTYCNPHSRRSKYVRCTVYPQRTPIVSIAPQQTRPQCPISPCQTLQNFQDSGYTLVLEPIQSGSKTIGIRSGRSGACLYV